MTERADASGCIPSPGEGKGLGLGLRPFLMKGRWDGLEHPSRRLGSQRRLVLERLHTFGHAASPNDENHLAHNI